MSGQRYFFYRVSFRCFYLRLFILFIYINKRASKILYVFIFFTHKSLNRSIVAPLLYDRNYVYTENLLFDLFY